MTRPSKKARTEDEIKVAQPRFNTAKPAKDKSHAQAKALCLLRSIVGFIFLSGNEGLVVDVEVLDIKQGRYFPRSAYRDNNGKLLTDIGSLIFYSNVHVLYFLFHSY